MVGDQRHDRVALELQLVEAVEEDAQPAVGHRHLRRVKRPHPLQQDLAAVAVQVARDGRVVGARGLGAVVVRVAVHVQVVARRRPRLVRLERVDDQCERTLLLGRLEHARGVAEHARREGLRLVVAVVAVGEVAADAVVCVRVLHLAGQPLVHLAVGHAGGGPPDLAAAPHEAVEAVAERAPGRRERQRDVVGHVGGEVAGAVQRTGERGADVGDRGPARLGQQPGVRVPAAEGEDAAPAEDRPARRNRRHRLWIEAREAQPFAGQRVDVGRSGPLAEGVIGAQRVDDDQHDVGPVVGLRDGQLVEPRERSRRGPRRLEELSARAAGAHAPQVGTAGGGPPATP